MTEHNHNKQLTLKEQSESYMLRQQINEIVYRLRKAEEKFVRHHSSGYCAFELIKAMHEVEVQLELLRPLLMDLGILEHYNFQAALAQWEEPAQS